MAETRRDRTFGPSAVLTPANAITAVRLLLSPVAFWLIVDRGSGWGLFVLWVAITASDSLDGYLARKQGTTRSGAFLDPLADKVLALGGLWAVVISEWVSEGAATPRVSGWLVPVVLISLREAVISGFRSFWARRGLAIQASNIAKAKTFLQFSSVSLVVWPWTNPYPWMATTCLWLAVAVAWISAAQYIHAGSRATSMGDD